MLPGGTSRQALLPQIWYANSWSRSEPLPAPQGHLQDSSKGSRKVFEQDN